MKLSEAAWIRVPLKLLREHGLTKSAAAVCCVLLDRATSAADVSAWVTVSMSDIAADVGCDVRTVRRAVADLLEIGLIERRSGKSSGVSNAYRITPGCVELCGRAAEVKHTAGADAAAAPRSARQKQRRSCPADDMDAAAYLSLVNRFDDDPLPGQMEFPAPTKSEWRAKHEKA